MDTFPIPPPPHDQGQERDRPEGREALVNRLIVEHFNLETLLVKELALIRVRFYALLPPHDHDQDHDQPEGREALVNRLVVEHFNLETLLVQKLALIRARFYALLPSNPPAVRGPGRAFTDPPAPAPAPAPARPDAGPDVPG